MRLGNPQPSFKFLLSWNMKKVCETVVGMKGLIVPNDYLRYSPSLQEIVVRSCDPDQQRLFATNMGRVYVA